MEIFLTVSITLAILAILVTCGDAVRGVLQALISLFVLLLASGLVALVVWMLVHLALG